MQGLKMIKDICTLVKRSRKAVDRCIFTNIWEACWQRQNQKNYGERPPRPPRRGKKGLLLGCTTKLSAEKYLFPYVAFNFLSFWNSCTQDVQEALSTYSSTQKNLLLLVLWTPCVESSAMGRYGVLQRESLLFWRPDGSYYWRRLKQV